MDDNLRAKLAQIGQDLEVPPGELSFEEAQAQGDQEEAAKAALRERLIRAFGVIHREQDAWSENRRGRSRSEKREDRAFDRQMAERDEVLAEFEASLDPEAFVREYEYEAGVALAQTSRLYRERHRP